MQGVTCSNRSKKLDQVCQIVVPSAKISQIVEPVPREKIPGEKAHAPSTVQPPPRQPPQRWACNHMGYSQRSSEPYSAGMQMGACRSRMREICAPDAWFLRSSLVPLNLISRAKFSESDCSSPRKPTFQVASRSMVCATAATPGVFPQSSPSLRSFNITPFGVAFQSMSELSGSRKSLDLDQPRIQRLSDTILNHSTQCSFRS